MGHKILKLASTGFAVDKDGDFKNTTLLLHGDGTNGAQNNTFTDSSTNAFTITRNGNTTQGTFSPFSQTGWSNYFDGSGDYLTAPNNTAFNIGSGDFTIECWAYISGSTGDLVNYSSGSGSNSQFAFDLYQSSSTQIVAGIFTGGTAYQITVNFVQNTWFHIALVRNGNTMTCYVNGVSGGTSNVTGVTANNPAGAVVNIGSLFNGSTPMTGYISNLRIVKGTAVYTAAFTPPTAALTAITNTSLLTCQSNRFIDNSSNAFAITANGNTSVQAFSPFAPTAAYDAATNGGSGYFDGSGDYLETPSSSAFTLGSSGDFTVECWAYLNGSQSASYAALMTSMASFSNGYTNRWALTVDGVSLRWYDSSGNVGVSTNLKAYEWTHIAAVRSGSTITLYVNGTSVGTQTSTQSYTTDGSVKIGYLSSAAYFNGYISDARVVKGTAIYTSNFTPPTTPLSAVGNTQLLCNFTNAGIIDSTAKNVLETVGNAQIDTGTKKFGTGSLEFDGNGDYLTVLKSDFFNFGTGNFTVEFWVYFTSVSGAQTLLDINYTTAANLLLQPSSGAMVLYVNGISSSITSSTTDTATVWNHYAIVRNGSTITMYRNGTSVGTVTYSGNVGNSTVPVYIGGSTGGGGYYLNGFLDDLRITKGVARYTANFTAPTKAFPDQ